MELCSPQNFLVPGNAPRILRIKPRLGNPIKQIKPTIAAHISLRWNVCASSWNDQGKTPTKAANKTPPKIKKASIHRSLGSDLFIIASSGLTALLDALVGASSFDPYHTNTITFSWDVAAF